MIYENGGGNLKKTEQITDLMFYIMATLTEPRHGYAMMNLLEEKSNGSISIGPASMYTIIKKLLNLGWIYLYDDSDSRRKTYLLTDEGKKILKEELYVRKQMIELAEKGLREEGE